MSSFKLESLHTDFDKRWAQCFESRQTSEIEKDGRSTNDSRVAAYGLRMPYSYITEHQSSEAKIIWRANTGCGKKKKQEKINFSWHYYTALINTITTI